MFENHYRAGIIGLGMIGGADQISGDALGQLVANMDGTHAVAYQDHARIDLVAGASRDPVGGSDSRGERGPKRTWIGER